MGHEGCAEVLDIGEGVTNLKIGDKVILTLEKGYGIQSSPPKYILE